jgi:hypothetical protein
MGSWMGKVNSERRHSQMMFHGNAQRKTKKGMWKIVAQMDEGRFWRNLFMDQAIAPLVFLNTCHSDA